MVYQGSGYYFHDKMPGYRLAGLAAATALQYHNSFLSNWHIIQTVLFLREDII